MGLPLFLLCFCLAVQETHQQLEKKQFVNLGDSFNFEENDGTEDGFSRALSDASLGGELGNEDTANSQMHISENNQGGISLGQNGDDLGSLGSLLGGNSLNSFSMNSLSSLGGGLGGANLGGGSLGGANLGGGSLGGANLGGDDLGLGEGGAKENSLLDSLGGTKSFLSTGDQLSNYGEGSKLEGNDESNNLLEAFGLKGNSENKESDSSLESLLGGEGKEKSLASLLNMGDENGKTKSQGESIFDGLNLDEAENNNNVENSANLGDSLNLGGNTDLLGLNKNDLAALLGGGAGNGHGSMHSSPKGSSKGNFEINDGSLGMLQKLLSSQGTTNGGDRQGIGDFEDGGGGGGGAGAGGGLSNELSNLDNVDDKLEKMLDGLGKVDTGAAQTANYGDNTAAQDSQPSEASDEMPTMGYHNHGVGMQSMPLMGHDDGGFHFGNMMGGMDMGGGMSGGMGGGMGGAVNGGMGGGGMGGDDISSLLQGIEGGQINPHHIRYGETVHAHASDKPGHANPVSPAEASARAKQVQKDAQLKHQEKLKKLKTRLAALKQKLEELQEEQSKKSQNANSPKAKRKEAIKKLLIKNLKLAALIASKEIQLEEAKENAFTGKKETDDLGLLDISKNMKETPKKSESDLISSKTKAKPLTDLSKKAEEEVNHLIKAQGLDKTRRDKASGTRDKALNAAQNNNDKEKASNASQNAKAKEGKVLSNATIIQQINATLAKLSASSPRNISVTPKAYKKLVQRITQLSPKKSEAVQEAALSSLYKALMKSKPTISGNTKKLSIKYAKVGCYKDNEKRVLSSLESSFKSPLDRNYKTRLNSLYKCARIAKLKGFPGFALENGGQCFGEKDILYKYKTYGESPTCGAGGKGGPWSLNVYKFV